MDPQKQQASERIKQANNILVTVSTNPSVDQLAACIGLTLSLNKMGKHATAVFSGSVPSTLEFLQPEKTIEKNTDSLRDFIIALDKSKADKLRYKVEDRVVKIFITPYKTSISEKDLEFSQGDFNVDVVLALGVHAQPDLDQAITSHGRILHDATIIAVNNQPGGELGSINWLDPNASSLSELGVQLIDLLDKKLIDGQIATAFLTGIVAETDRFSNNKTSPQTMSISAELMGAGANQQLVATKLEEPAAAPPPPPAPIANQGDNTQETSPKKSDDGTLEISHVGDETSGAGVPSVPLAEHGDEQTPQEATEETEKPTEPRAEPLEEKEPTTPPPQIKIDEHGELASDGLDALGLPPRSNEPPAISHHDEPPKMVLQPPTLGGPLNAASASAFGEGEQNDAGLPGLPVHEADIPPSMEDDKPAVGPTITPPESDEPQNAPGTSFLGDQPIEPSEAKDAQSEQAGAKVSETDQKSKLPAPDETLSEIERDVHSSHLAPTPPSLPQVTSDAPIATPVAPPSDVSATNAPMLPPIPGADTSSTVTPAAPANDTPFTVPNMPVGTPEGADNQFIEESAANNTDSQAASLDSARDAVAQAIGESAPPPQPIAALNAQPLGGSLNQPPLSVTAPDGSQQPAFDNPQPQVPAFTPSPAAPAMDTANIDNYSSQGDPNAPPPVPPPMMPPMPPAQ